MNPRFLINDFEGPLDLLLHLVKSSKMDIYEINTTEIINQYLEYIHALEELNIDIASEYLVMASELVHLKSRLLLGYSSEDTVEEDCSIESEDDLKQKIVEYEKYKKLSENFRELEEKRGEVFTKLPESLLEYKEDNMSVTSDLTLDDLFNAFLQFQERHKLEKPLTTRITRKEISVEERKNNIRDILKTQKEVNFFELFESFTKEYIVVTFLSILDMSKNEEILIKQKRNFDEILIEARN